MNTSSRFLVARVLYCTQWEQALVQFSIAAFALVADWLAIARLCRAHSLVSLANVYNVMERRDRAPTILQEAVGLRGQNQHHPSVRDNRPNRFRNLHQT